jgi:hypothetical protein
VRLPLKSWLSKTKQRLVTDTPTYKGPRGDVSHNGMRAKQQTNRLKHNKILQLCLEYSENILSRVHNCFDTFAADRFFSVRLDLWRMESSIFQTIMRVKSSVHREWTPFFFDHWPCSIMWLSYCTTK